MRNEPPLCIDSSGEHGAHIQLATDGLRINFPALKRNTVLCAITRSFGTVARILIRLPVIPSLRYSCSGSRLAFSKGKTAASQ